MRFPNKKLYMLSAFLLCTSPVYAEGLPANPWANKKAETIYNNIQETAQKIEQNLNNNSNTNLDSEQLEQAFSDLRANLNKSNNSPAADMPTALELWQKYNNLMQQNTASADNKSSAISNEIDKQQLLQLLSKFKQETAESGSSATAPDFNFNKNDIPGYQELERLGKKYNSYKNKVERGYNNILQSTGAVSRTLQNSIKTLEKESGINIQDIVKDTKKMMQ